MEQGNTGEIPEQSCYRKVGVPAIIVSRLMRHCGLRRFIMVYREWSIVGYEGFIDLARAAYMPLFCIVFLEQLSKSNR